MQCFPLWQKRQTNVDYSEAHQIILLDGCGLTRPWYPRFTGKTFLLARRFFVTFYYSVLSSGNTFDIVFLEAGVNNTLFSSTLLFLGGTFSGWTVSSVPLSLGVSLLKSALGFFYCCFEPAMVTCALQHLMSLFGVIKYVIKFLISVWTQDLVSDPEVVSFALNEWWWHCWSTQWLSAHHS